MSHPEFPPVVRLISAAETTSLRAKILRPGYPLADSIFDGDEHPDTFHVGVFQDDELVGIASFYTDALPPTYTQLITQEAPEMLQGQQWRLRGMATDSHHQGKGYGKTLLLSGIEQISQRGGGLLWCNARSSAVGFYKKLGFRTWGEEFEVPTIGPHFVMTLTVASQPE